MKIYELQQREEHPIYNLIGVLIIGTMIFINISLLALIL